MRWNGVMAENVGWLGGCFTVDWQKSEEENDDQRRVFSFEPSATSSRPRHISMSPFHWYSDIVCS